MAKDNPIYVQLAKRTETTSYNLAVADWFGKPEILSVNTDGWTGCIGHTIRIRAQDDTCVTSVQVTIHSDGNVLEVGEAVRSQTDGLVWTYMTTTNLMGSPNLQLDVNAYDLAGNFGASSVSLN